MEEWAANTMHSTAKQAAKFASRAEAEKLIIGHFSSRYKNIDGFLDEARAVFSNTELATEGKTYSV
jgi:ribonuclease Z